MKKPPSSSKEVMGRRSNWTLARMMICCGPLLASGENSAAIAARLKRTAAGIRKRATSLGIGLAGSRKALGLKVNGQMTAHVQRAALGRLPTTDMLRKLLTFGNETNG